MYNNNNNNNINININNNINKIYFSQHASETAPQKCERHSSAKHAMNKIHI